jgi:hypothetical protein
MGCKEQLRSGQCAAPWLREIDRGTKTVVQYCSEECGCQLDDMEESSDGGPPQPRVAKMDGYDAVSGCCKQ